MEGGWRSREQIGWRYYASLLEHHTNSGSSSAYAPG